MKRKVLEWVKAYKTSHGFIVDISGDCFEMNDQADQPNGVNMYAGRRGDNRFGIPNSVISKYPAVAVKSLPEGVKNAIRSRGGKL